MPDYGGTQPPEVERGGTHKLRQTTCRCGKIFHPLGCSRITHMTRKMEKGRGWPPIPRQIDSRTDGQTDGRISNIHFQLICVIFDRSEGAGMGPSMRKDRRPHKSMIFPPPSGHLRTERSSNYKLNQPPGYENVSLSVKEN